MIEEDYIPEPKKQSKPRKPRATKTKKDDVVDQGALYQAEKLLPSDPSNLRQRREVAIPRTVTEINRIGSECGAGVSEISGMLLDRVKVSDTGDIGKNLTDVLALTQKVDFDKLKPEQRGLVAKFRNLFTDTKVRVLSEFQTVTEQMEMIVHDIEGGISRMHGETDWLVKHIMANNDYIDEMEDIRDCIEQAITEEQDVLRQMQMNTETRTNAIFDQSNVVDALEKRYNKILRFIHLAKLTDPQLKSMLVVNQSNIEKFEGIKTDMLPMWKSKLSMELLALQQSRDNQLSEVYDKTANRIIVDTSKSVGNNMRDAAKAANRSTVEIESLRQVQTNIISALQDAIKINEEGRTQRNKDIAELRKMNTDLDSSMRGIADKANEARLRRP